MKCYAEDMPKKMGEMAREFATRPLDEAMKEAGIVVQVGISENFTRAVDSHGGAWPDRVDDLPHPLLQATGALYAAATGQGPGSIRRVVGGRTAEVGVDKSLKLGGIPGAAAHNFGHPPFNLPQREWLYATGHVLDEVADVIAEHAMTELFG